MPSEQDKARWTRTGHERDVEDTGSIAFEAQAFLLADFVGSLTFLSSPLAGFAGSLSQFFAPDVMDFEGTCMSEVDIATQWRHTSSEFLN